MSCRSQRTLHEGVLYFGESLFPLENGVSPDCRDVCGRGCKNANPPLTPNVVDLSIFLNRRISNKLKIPICRGG